MSIWSAAGLALAIAIGRTDFERMLVSATEMDRHFCSAPLSENFPVILGLTGIWNRNFCGHAARAVFPYDRHLALLPDYLQQLEMESNGKSVPSEGTPLTGPSAPLVWGGVGTNAQHTVFQFLHQGSDLGALDRLAAHAFPGCHQHRRSHLAHRFPLHRSCPQHGNRVSGPAARSDPGAYAAASHPSGAGTRQDSAAAGTPGKAGAVPAR